MASYEPAPRPGVAEVAFAVPDDMHGRGIATLLLEHLVSVARERGLRAFTAEALPENRPMLAVFADAGLPVHRQMTDGVVELTFPIPAGEDDRSLDGYLDSVAVRESRADVASLRPLLQPASVAVVGASRRRGTVGREILHNIVTGGFAGTVYPVNPRATSLEGLHCLASVDDLPEGVDLAVLAVPAAAVTDVAERCGRRGVRSLVVITSGLGARGPDLLAVCRRHGMRLVGPNCFGVAVPPLGLDATFAASHPAPGTAGLVVQSGGIGVSLLAHLSDAGHRRVLVRLGRRQVRRVQQRHADLVGAGRPDEAGDPVRGVVREPAQVRQDRAPGGPADAGDDRDRRQVRRGPGRRGLAHRGGRDAAGDPGGTVRAGGHHRGARTRRSWWRSPPCWPRSRCPPGTGWPS